jgi:hypothetical protein
MVAASALAEESFDSLVSLVRELMCGLPIAAGGQEGLTDHEVDRATAGKVPPRRENGSRADDPYGDHGAARLGGNDEGAEMEASDFGSEGEPAFGEQDDGAS